VLTISASFGPADPEKQGFVEHSRRMWELLLHVPARYLLTADHWGLPL